TYSAEMRYRGQSFEIDTRLDPDRLAAGDLGALAEAFHAEHERIYDHADRKAQIQVISIRLVISGKTVKPEFPKLPLQPGVAESAKAFEVYLDGAKRQIGLYHRADLLPGQTLEGPAVIAQEDCTTVVPPGFGLRVDEFGNLRISAGEYHEH